MSDYARPGDDRYLAARTRGEQFTHANPPAPRPVKRGLVARLFRLLGA